ncbi:MAG: hypothetical protein EB125_01390 [Betaproteobacteria bacterium]|nr:hypothetical protein [Betaproteobacteria bacterium]
MKTNTNANSASDELTMWGRALVLNGLLMAILPWFATQATDLSLPFVCMGCLMMLAGAALCGVFQGQSISLVKQPNQTSA